MKTALLAVLAAAILAPAADANYRVGLSEQDPAMFSQPAWQSLKLKRVRYIIPWDYYKDAGQHNEVIAFLNAAHASKQDVLLAFSARRGCYTNGKYSKSSACRAPSTSAYKSAVSRFHKEFPWVKTFTPWNEENHVFQPTARKPKLARRMKKLQQRLGVHQDSVVARQELRAMGIQSHLGGDNAFTYGLLFGCELRRAERVEESLPRKRKV